MPKLWLPSRLVSFHISVVSNKVIISVVLGWMCAGGVPFQAFRHIGNFLRRVQSQAHLVCVRMCVLSISEASVGSVER